MTIQFYHKKCKSILLIECSSIFKTTCSSAGTTRTQLKPGPIEITVNEESSPPKFTCSRCNNQVKDADEIMSVCNSCGSVFNVKELQRLFKSGMIVCEKCKKEQFEGEQARPVEKLMSTISM